MWYGQNLVIKRMLAAGYKTTDQGHCFGLAHMAMQAFFDGVILYQKTRDHRHLFEKPKEIQGQDAAKTMPIILPIALDSEETKPLLINCHTGAYNKTELAQYLDLIKTQLGSNSFSMPRS